MNAHSTTSRNSFVIELGRLFQAEYGHQSLFGKRDESLGPELA